jgi:hypothetical protein
MIGAPGSPLRLLHSRENLMLRRERLDRAAHRAGHGTRPMGFQLLGVDRVSHRGARLCLSSHIWFISSPSRSAQRLGFAYLIGIPYLIHCRPLIPTRKDPAPILRSAPLRPWSSRYVRWPILSGWLTNTTCYLRVYFGWRARWNLVVPSQFLRMECLCSIFERENKAALFFIWLESKVESSGSIPVS